MEIIKNVLASLDFDGTTFICQVILFFVLHFSLNMLVYQPIMQIRNRRDKKIADSQAAAEAAKEEVRRLKEDYEQKVRGARAEGQMALQKATEIAEAERKSRIEKARKEASDILEAARKEADEVMSKAEESLETQSEDVAKAIVSKLLSASLGDDDGKAIVAQLGGDS